MTNSEQIKPVEAIDRPDAIEEMDDEETALMDEYLNVIEEIRKLPDARERLERIRGTIQILAGHPERAGLKNAEPAPVTDEEIDDQEQTAKLQQLLEDLKKRPESRQELGFIEILLETPDEIKPLWLKWRFAAGQEKAKLTSTLANQKPRAQPKLSDDDIRDLVRRIITDDDDDAVKAFILLVDTIARNDEWVDRNNMATQAFDAAYRMTIAYHQEAERFFNEAGATL